MFQVSLVQSDSGLVTSLPEACSSSPWVAVALTGGLVAQLSPLLARVPYWLPPRGTLLLLHWAQWKHGFFLLARVPASGACAEVASPGLVH